MLSDNVINPRDFKTTMVNLRKVKLGVEIRDVAKNLFSFRFFRHKDRDLILKGAPWNFDKKLIVLKKLRKYESPEEVDLSRSPFWVRLNELPIGF